LLSVQASALYYVFNLSLLKMFSMRNDLLFSSPRRMVRRFAVRGFTLIEIMVVVVIMGILAALVVPKLMGRTDDARIIAAKQDIATLMQALKLYKLDNQRYPNTEQGLAALITKPTTGPAANGWKSGGYIDKLPKDPWGNPYQFLSPGVKGEVDIFSLGADGQPGGTGNDADIGSWDL
jgi:general secretion pathway protein G